MLPKLTSAFHKTPPRLKDASLAGMPLHQKQRELKLEVEASQADMLRTNPNGIKSKGKGDIRIKSNLSHAKKDDPVAYNRACIRHEISNNELNMFKKANAKGPESGQQIPGFLFPGHETPGSGRPLSPNLTFEQPQNSAGHGSLAAKSTPASNPQATSTKPAKNCWAGTRPRPATESDRKR